MVTGRLERIRLIARRETASTLDIHPRRLPGVSDVFPVMGSVVSLVSEPVSFFVTVLHTLSSKTAFALHFPINLQWFLVRGPQDTPAFKGTLRIGLCERGTSVPRKGRLPRRHDGCDECDDPTGHRNPPPPHVTRCIIVSDTPGLMNRVRSELESIDYVPEDWKKIATLQKPCAHEPIL